MNNVVNLKRPSVLPTQQATEQVLSPDEMLTAVKQLRDMMAIVTASLESTRRVMQD